jgi:hypothetical protein
MKVGFGENHYPNLEIHLPRHQEEEEQKGWGKRWRVRLHPLLQGGALVGKSMPEEKSCPSNFKL